MWPTIGMNFTFYFWTRECYERLTRLFSPLHLTKFPSCSSAFLQINEPCLSDICIWEKCSTIKVSFYRLWFHFSLWKTFILLHPIIIISHNLYRTFFFWKLNMCGINSHIIHSTSNNEKLLRRECLLILADALMKKSAQIKRRISL